VSNVRVLEVEYQVMVSATVPVVVTMRLSYGSNSCSNGSVLRVNRFARRASSMMLAENEQEANHMVWY
jgi:hypothetical protein